MTSAWKVTQWSTELGLGRVDGELGSFEVQRADVVVDDLVIGEEVNLVLEEVGDALVPRDVTPSAWRENAPPLPPFELAEALAALATQVSGAFGRHARLSFVFAEEDRARLEVHDVDWPPPITPPMAKLAFDGVVYLKLPAFSESYEKMTIIPWAHFKKHRRTLLRYWSLGDDVVPSDAWVYRFEPRHMNQSAGYVIAASLTAEVSAKRRR